MSDGSSCDPLLFDHFCFDNFNNKTKKANVYQIKHYLPHRVSWLLLFLQSLLVLLASQSPGLFWLHRASWFLLAFQNLLVCSSYTEPLDFTGFTVSWFVPATQSLLVLLALQSPDLFQFLVLLAS
jgi:hypothetical protein